MTMQKGICEECKKEYDYEYNPKYPRKYCHECSAKKKAEFAGAKQEEKVETARPGEFKTPNYPKPITAVKVAENGSQKHTTTYVSYAKDIFLGLLESDNSTDREMLMRDAIELVKQARDSF